MKTEKTKVEGTMYIWAYPKTEWELSQELKEAGEGMEHTVLPFKYRITSSDTNYSQGTVLVADFEVVGTVPEGVDLVKAAIKTLRAEIEEARKEYEKKKVELEEQIGKLALIEYQPGD